LQSRRFQQAGRYSVAQPGTERADVDDVQWLGVLQSHGLSQSRRQHSRRRAWTYEIGVPNVVVGGGRPYFGHSLAVKGMIRYHLCGWCVDGGQMAKLRLIEPRRKEPESEKITINLGYVDLGRVDLLVQEGFYSNRTDFIRTAIRNQLGTHDDVLKQTVARRSMVLGLQRYSRQDLESVRAAGEQLHIQVLGLATIDDDVPAQLAAQTIASIVILGALRASPKVKAALADRIR
jgi:Arc/MetJ-type ribon-helix-helix transcriptional regulator